MARSQGALVIAGIPSVNLMPRAELDRRDRVDQIRTWAGWIFISIGVVALTMAGALYLQFAAGERLASEQARTNALISEIASLSDVRAALTTERALESFRADAMAADLDWEPLHATIASILPAGVALHGYDLEVGGVPMGDDPTVEVGLTGTLTFTSPTPVEIVALVRGYRELEGVTDADGREVMSLTTGAGGDGAGPALYTYVLTVTLDQTIYTATEAEPNAGASAPSAPTPGEEESS